MHRALTSLLRSHGETCTSVYLAIAACAAREERSLVHQWRARAGSRRRITAKRDAAIDDTSGGSVGPEVSGPLPFNIFVSGASRAPVTLDVGSARSSTPPQDFGASTSSATLEAEAKGGGGGGGGRVSGSAG
eukprot:scaffold229290_cov28-Tisochrysis_lutea.AAC.2